MVLKQAKFIERTNDDYFCNTCLQQGSPVGRVDTEKLDIVDSVQVCRNVVGLLLNDVIDIDISKCHINFYRDEVMKGGKVNIATRGTFVVNTIDSSFKKAKPLCNIFVDYRTGKFTTRNHKHTSEKVGRFIHNDGDFAKIEINI